MKKSGATRVVVLASTGAQSHVVPAGTSAVVGRAKDCPIVIALPSISRHHLRITSGTSITERPTVEDLGTVHGVRVAGRKVTPGQKATVQRGDVVDVGDAILVAHPEDEPTTVRVESRVVELLARCTDVSVLVIGESGTGKSFVASSIAGACQVQEDVDELPRGGRFVATTKRHDLVPPPGVIGLLLPPLRDRPRAVEPLAERFLEAACERVGMPVPRISREALGTLVRHSWLGNVRELKSTIDRALAMSGGREIEPRHLVFESAPLPPQTMQTLPATISSVPPPRKG